MRNTILSLLINSLLLPFIQLVGEAQPNIPAATSPTAQQTQVLRGRITDVESNAPLSGIKITVVLNGTVQRGAISDRAGNYRIAGIPLGRHTVRFSGLAYQEQLIPEVLMSAGKETTLDISMTEKVIALSAVSVDYDRSSEKITTVNEYAAVSSRAFNIEDTKKYAGALGDPSRMAQNFAGVVGANDSRNDIVVRGNSPAGMLWQLEGLNIPNPNHYGSLGSTGGPVNILNNNTVDKSDFLTGAFPAQYGNAFAGVFDLRLRNGNNNKAEFLAQMGFNGFELGAEGPIGSSGASYLINYRYSTLGIFKTLGINFGTGSAVPNYQDLNFKINLPLGENSRLSVFGIGGTSDIEFLGNEEDTTKNNLYGSENENTKARYKTGIAGISYENNISPNTFVKFTLGASATEEHFNGDSIDVRTRIAYPSGEAVFTTQKYSAIGQFRHKFDSRNSISAGLTIDRQQFRLFNKEIIQGGKVDIVRVNIEDGAMLTQGFAQWKHRFSDNFSVIAGAHAQHYTLGKTFAIEPRLSLQYLLNENQTLSLGYGLHSQAQNIYNYFVESSAADGSKLRGNMDLGFTRSHHVVLGYDWAFAESWRLKAELYYQSLFDIPISRSKSTFSMINTGASFGPVNEGNLVNEGTARNLGAELTLERFFNNGMYALLTASIFDSQYKGSDGIERNTAFNMGYVLNMLAGKEFSIGEHNVLALSLKLSTTGGRYLTPLDFQESLRRGDAVYDETRAFSERQTPYFRLDAKIAYRIEFGSSTLEFAIDLQNVTNNQNVFLQSYNRRTNSVVTQYQQAFFPVPMVRYTF